MPGRSGGGLRFVPAEWGDASRGQHQSAAVVFPRGSAVVLPRGSAVALPWGSAGRHDRARPVG
ncbi:MAG TPA: hypothetical protein VGR20_02660, partial [Acidimicrobiia bacterium]|nr:hypothetical protein [Acidimicrobiia bacterium]